MGKASEKWIVWGSALWELVYAAGVIFYLVTSHGTLWAGIPAIAAAPHAVVIAVSGLLQIAGICLHRARLLQASCIGCWLAAVLFPPLHVFLLPPALLTAFQLLIQTKARCAV